MAARHTSRPEMTWLEMDIFDLQFDEEFDLVIDKGGYTADPFGSCYSEMSR